MDIDIDKIIRDGKPRTVSTTGEFTPVTIVPSGPAAPGYTGGINYESTGLSTQLKKFNWLMPVAIIGALAIASVAAYFLFIKKSK